MISDDAVEDRQALNCMRLVEWKVRNAEARGIPAKEMRIRVYTDEFRQFARRPDGSYEI